jgi:GTP-binding protein Era
MENGDFKAGFVAIVGRPNVGKSTLMNALLKQKITIVTPKPQTTRRRVLGILTGDGYQMIFLDTPGLVEPRYLLQEAMMHIADNAIADADIILLMAEANTARLSGGGDSKVLQERLQNVGKPLVLALNKSDLVENKNEILPIIEFYRKSYPVNDIVPISALSHEGIDELLKCLVQTLPVNPPFYPSDMITDHPERFFVGELIRERIFSEYSQEVPYSCEVAITEFKERSRGKDFISAEIYVERDSQRGILIGKGGEKLKHIGESARKEIEMFLGRPVYIELRVKVREKWRDSKDWLKRFGYE